MKTEKTDTIRFHRTSIVCAVEKRFSFFYEIENWYCADFLSRARTRVGAVGSHEHLLRDPHSYR
jgi:hypothetical protein